MFTKSQWIGVAVFASIIAVFIGVFWLMDYVTKPKEVPVPEVDSIGLSKIQILEENSRKNTFHYYAQADTIPLFLHRFDPNTADSIELLQLGFRPWMVKNMLKYRAKGGKWRNKESMKKIYGVDDELYRQIEPYIDITLPADTLQTTDTTKRIFQIKKDTILSLNSCDTTDLKFLPGIGSGYAKRIVNHRKLLGGFVSADQLREVEGIPMETIESIIPHFIVNTDSIQPILVNRASVERLNGHPYIDFKQAKDIYELRRTKFRLDSIGDLRQLKCLTEDDLTRLKPYLSFK